MGQYLIEFKRDAINDFKKFKKSGNKKSIKKLNQIYLELKINPFAGIGNPEALKYELSGFWSRRINNKDRIIYKVDEKGIKQTWLAEKLGKSFNMVNSYVQNRQQPRLEVLYRIAEILDVEVKDLLIERKQNVK